MIWEIKKMKNREERDEIKNRAKKLFESELLYEKEVLEEEINK